MRKFYLLIALFMILMSSCEKIDSSLIGNWGLTESKFIITANEDFTFVDVFGSSWEGIIKIDNKEFDPSLFRYYFDNVWPQYQLVMQELKFGFLGPQLEVRYQGIRYILDKTYTFSVADGVFKADGIAKYKDKSITVHVDLTMPKKELKKGDQFSVRSAYGYIPYSKLEFNDGGKLQTDFLTGDILEKLSGTWSVNDNKLNISVKKYSNHTFQYSMNANSLLLSQDKITEESYPSYISPFAGKISRITYQALYMRE